MALEKESKEIRSFAILMTLALAFFGTLIIVIKNRRVLEVANSSKWLYAIAAVFLVVGTIAPIVLKPLYKGWMLLAKGLGWLNTNIIMFLIFYLGFTPMAFILRKMGKDFLKLKLEPSAESFWIKKTEKFEKESMFRQY